MKKMTLGVAFGLATKETGYKIGLGVAILLLALIIIGYAFLGWDWPAKWYGIPMFFVAVYLILARPCNINADPINAGYRGYLSN
jgi:hypothetical protein